MVEHLSAKAHSHKKFFFQSIDYTPTEVLIPYRKAVFQLTREFIL
jgi:hypothetical protein